MAARFSRQMKASALLCAALFPLTFLYDEILLRLFAGEGLFPFLQYPFLTALAAGLLAAVLTSFGKKSLQRVLKTAVLLLASLWFIIQTLLNRVYAMYFPFSSIGGEAGDVASEYTDMLFRTILLGIPIIVLYLLPPALYILSLLRRKRRTVPDTVSLSGHAKKREIAVLLGLFVILQSASVLSESHGSQADLYGMGYTFDNATRVFGLLTSTRLDLRYLLFGMDESGSFDLDTSFSYPEASAYFDDDSDSTEKMPPDPSPDLSSENITSDTAAASSVSEAASVPAAASTPSVTPERKASPTPAATSAPTAAPKREISPSPAATSEPSAAPERKVTPSHTAAPTPTVTPERKVSPSPAATSTPTAVSKREISPSPAAASKPAVTPKPEVSRNSTEVSAPDVSGKTEISSGSDTVSPETDADSIKVKESSAGPVIIVNKKQPVRLVVFSDDSAEKNAGEEPGQESEEETAAEEVSDEEPEVEESVIDESAVEESVAEESAVEESVLEESVLEESVIDDESAAEESVAEESVVEESVIDESAAEESVAEESVIDESVIDESVVEESVIEESVIDESAAEESVAEERPVYTGPNSMDLDFSKLAEEETGAAKTISEYAATLEPSMKNEYTGIFKGKNLILICAEAYNDSFLSPELTPTLWRMSHQGFWFSDFYQPAWGGSTSTGEFSMLFGLAPLNSAATIRQTQKSNNYFTMGNQLQRLGYSSWAFHNGTNTYYNRDQTHRNLGYDRWIAMGSGLEKLSGGRYIDDRKMFDLTMDLYLDEQPFSVYYMSVSGHAPYSNAGDPKVTDHIETVKKILGDQYDKYSQNTINYICYQMVLEDALTLMLQKLEEAGIAENTVIAMTTDHYPYGLRGSEWGNSGDNIENLYGHEAGTPWGLDKTGCIIWSECLETDYADLACEISAPAYSLDMLPTLSNLFGLEYDSRLLIGRDVFSGQTPLVLWNNGSWITDKGRFNARNGKYESADSYRTESGTDQAAEASPADSEQEKEYIEWVRSIVKNKLAFSKQVIDNDYYGILFGKDELEPEPPFELPEQQTEDSSKP